MNKSDLLRRLVGEIGENNAKMREVWVSRQLQQIEPEKSILDVGAGEQRYRKYMEHLCYTSQDFSQYDGSGDGLGLQTGSWDCSSIDIVSDITNIPVADSSYDVVLCTEVLEHVPDPRKAIKELVRVLKPRGKLIITAPFCSLTHFAPYHYYAGFNKYFYQNVFEEFSCSIDELSASGDWFDYLSQEIRRLPSLVHRFTGGKVSMIDKILILIILFRMKRYQARQKISSSDELLTYGYHIVASKLG